MEKSAIDEKPVNEDKSMKEVRSSSMNDLDFFRRADKPADVKRPDFPTIVLPKLPTKQISIIALEGFFDSSKLDKSGVSFVQEFAALIVEPSKFISRNVAQGVPLDVLNGVVASAVARFKNEDSGEAEVLLVVRDFGDSQIPSEDSVVVLPVDFSQWADYRELDRSPRALLLKKEYEGLIKQCSKYGIEAIYLPHDFLLSHLLNQLIERIPHA